MRLGRDGRLMALPAAALYAIYGIYALPWIVPLALLVLLLLLFGGGGLISSSLQILWIILLIGLILWALGFVFRGTSGGRWYRW